MSILRLMGVLIGLGCLLGSFAAPHNVKAATLQRTCNQADTFVTTAELAGSFVATGIVLKEGDNIMVYSDQKAELLLWSNKSFTVNGREAKVHGGVYTHSVGWAPKTNKGYFTLTAAEDVVKVISASNVSAAKQKIRTFRVCN